MIVRSLARPLMAGIFVVGGIDTLRKPGPRARKAKAVIEPVAKQAGLEGIDPEQVTRIDAGVKIVAALMLATGRLPRVSALVLAGSLLPTTVAGHRFWEESESMARKGQLMHFLKNFAILGGLMTMVVDTGGRESLPHKARRLAARAGDRP